MKKTFIILSLAAMALSSCLKDKPNTDFSGLGAIIELPMAAYVGPGNTVPEALTIQSTPTTVPVLVNVASPSPLSTAVNVTLGVDAAALAAYNTANGTSYVIPPSNAYSIPSNKVTIAAGQRLATLNILVNTTSLDLTQQYILPISITDAGGQKISGNFKTVLLNIQLKNKYDGTYSLSGYIHRDADLTLGGPFHNLTSVLETQSGTSVSFTQVWANGSQTGGVNPITFTVDPSTNKVTVTSTANGTLMNIPGYDSRYDPATKTFYVSFVWNGTDPSHRSATDTLVYTGPR